MIRPSGSIATVRALVEPSPPVVSSMPPPEGLKVGSSCPVEVNRAMTARLLVDWDVVEL